VEQIWLSASLWLALALAAAFVANLVRLPTAVCEIVVGALAPVAIVPLLGAHALEPSKSWVVFLAGAGSLLLTFLAGTELDADMLRATWREAASIGMIAFVLPCAGVAAAAHYLLGWQGKGVWIAAVALATGSVSVVYTIMLDLGLNHTRLGRSLLAASYVDNLFAAIAMGVLLAPFTGRTAIFVGMSAVVFAVSPVASARFFGRLRSRVSQPDIRYLLALLFGLGGLSVWAGGEAILPAYVMGMVLAGIVGRNATLIHNLRVVAFAILTPFYFLRAGALVSIPALAIVPLAVPVLLAAKVLTKFTGATPLLAGFGYTRRESNYYSLMLSTGLGLGSITASIGLARGIIDQTQYSLIVAAVIASAVVPTALAACFVPKHLVRKRQPAVHVAAARQIELRESAN
jgi:glutathione-regulated potassium-efflux system ancillary protein KefC